MKNNTQEKSTQEMWDTMKNLTLEIIGTADREEHVNGIDQIFNKIVEENCLKLCKDRPIRIQKLHRTPNGKK